MCVTTLTITRDNAESVTALGNLAGETTLQLASFIGERLAYLALHPGATTTETCSDPYHEFTDGSAAYAFQDKDGDGSLTPGDLVTITLAGCFSQTMADHVSGTITLTLTTPAAASGGASFAAAATLDAVQLTGLEINGSFNAEYDAAETKYTVLARIGSSPLELRYQSGGFNLTDTVTVSNATLSKIIDYTLPRYSVQIALTCQSQRLQGAFSVTTPTTITGRLGIYPDTGMETFQSGSSVLHYVAQNVSDNEYVAASLDQDGSGQFVDLGSSLLFWEQGVNGFLWWEPRGYSQVETGSRPSYMTNQLAAWQMQLMFTEPQQSDPINGILSTGLNVGTPIKLFFNGPVDPASASFMFATASFPVPGQVAIPAVPVVSGAIVTLTGQTQLQHGEQYYLQSDDRVNTTWTTSGLGADVSMQLLTLNDLQASASPSPAVAAPGQTVQLLSAGSASTSSTIAGYSWTQTGGTPVTLTGADTANASFVVPAAAQAGDALHFTLTVTDADGKTDSVPITTFVLTDITQPFLYYRAQQSPAVGQEPEDAILESSANGAVRTEFDTTLNLFRFIFTGSGSAASDELQFFISTPIVPGTYSSSTTPGGAPFLLTSELVSQCNTDTTWQFIIYEAQAAPDGTAAKFSADFTIGCPGGSQPPFVGSVRVNSTKPLP